MPQNSTSTAFAQVATNCNGLTRCYEGDTGIQEAIDALELEAPAGNRFVYG